MQNLTMVIYIQFKFHAIPSIGYLVMAEDGKVDGWTEGRTTPNYISSAFWGGGGDKIKGNFVFHFEVFSYYT